MIILGNRQYLNIISLLVRQESLLLLLILRVRDLNKTQTPSIIPQIMQLVDSANTFLNDQSQTYDFHLANNNETAECLDSGLAHVFDPCPWQCLVGVI